VVEVEILETFGTEMEDIEDTQEAKVGIEIEETILETEIEKEKKTGLTVKIEELEREVSQEVILVEKTTTEIEAEIEKKDAILLPIVVKETNQKIFFHDYKMLDELLTCFTLKYKLVRIIVRRLD